MIRRRYVDGPSGQVHLRESGAASGTVPLVCLHATAYSSRSFEPLMRALGDARHVIAIDAPGYGESDPPPVRPDIAAYAAAMLVAIDAALGQGEFDLLGYHTGVTIACELALRSPERVRQLAVMGIPYLRALDFDAWRTKLATPHILSDDLDQFDERWDYLVAKRPEGLSLEQGFANFVDELRAWPNGSWAHEAMFDWDAAANLPRLAVPVVVLNPPTHLASASRVAAALIPGAQIIEMDDVGGAPLQFAAAAIAALLSSSAA